MLLVLLVLLVVGGVLSALAVRGTRQQLGEASIMPRRQRVVVGVVIVYSASTRVFRGDEDAVIQQHPAVEDHTTTTAFRQHGHLCLPEPLATGSVPSGATPLLPWLCCSRLCTRAPLLDAYLGASSSITAAAAAAAAAIAVTVDADVLALTTQWQSATAIVIFIAAAFTADCSSGCIVGA